MEEITKKIMINIGCGPIGHKEWVNIDYGVLAFFHRFSYFEKLMCKLNLWPKGYNYKWPDNLFFKDCRKGLPFKSNSVHFIYTSHFLEHLEKYKVVKLIRDCYTCLVPGGVMRIVLPDVDIIVGEYINNKNNIKKVEIINNYFYSGAPQDKFPTIIQKIKNYFIRGHHWMYNFDYLKEMLVESGFKADSIVRCNYQQGKVPNLEVLDFHKEISFFLEATK